MRSDKRLYLICFKNTKQRVVNCINSVSESDCDYGPGGRYNVHVKAIHAFTRKKHAKEYMKKYELEENHTIIPIDLK